MCTVVCVACEYGECDGNAGVGDGGGVVVMSARHECELCKCGVMSVMSLDYL